MADRYWRGGTGTWNTSSTTNWSATSNGAGGASVPTAADNVIFDQAGTYTVTMTGALTCLDITVSSGTVTFATGTTPTLSVSGSMSLLAGTVWSSTGAITFNSTTTGRTITTNGTTLNGAVTFSGASGSWSLGSTLTLLSTLTTTLTSGALNLNGFNLSTGLFSSSNANTRSIAFGSNNIILSTTTATSLVLSMATATGFTCTGDGAFTAAADVTKTFTFGTTGGGTSTNAPNVTLTGTGTSVVTFTTTSWFNHLIFGTTNFAIASTTLNLNSITCSSAASAAYANLTINFVGTGTYTFDSNKAVAAMTINHSGTTTQGNAAAQVTGALTLTSGTLDISSNSGGISCGTFNSSNSNTRSIAFGAYNIQCITATAGLCLSIATATNFTCTATTGGFSIPLNGARTVQFGSTAGGSATNAPNLFFYTGASIPTITTGSWFKTLSFTGSTGSPAATVVNLSGDLTLASGVGVYTSLSVNMVGTGTITPVAKTIAALVINNGAGTTTLQAALGCSSFTMTAGTINFATFNLTGSSAAIYTAGTLDNIGTISCTTWSISSGSTFTLASGSISASTSFTLISGTFNFNGGSISTPSFIHTAGTVTLGANFSLQTTCTYTFTAGTLALAGFNLSTGLFSSSNANVRSIAFGIGVISLTTTTPAAQVLAMATATNFTWTGTGGFAAAASVTRTYSFGTTAGGTSTTAPNLTLTGSGTAIQTFTTGSYFNILDFGTTAFNPGSTVLNLESLTLSSGGTFTSLSVTMIGTGTFTTAGKSISTFTINHTGTTTLVGNLTVAVTTNTNLTSGTLNLDGYTLTTGVFTSSNSNTRSIAFGSGNIVLNTTTTLQVNLDMATATGFTWTGTGGFTADASITRTFTFGTTGGSATNAPNLTLTGSGTAIATLTTASWFNTLNFGTTAFAVATTTLNVNALTLSSSGTYTSLSVTMRGTGTITNNTKPIAALVINNGAGTTTLSAALTCTNYTNTAGTIDFANFNLTCSGSGGYTAGTLSNIGTITCSQWTCTGTFTLTQGTITPSSFFTVVGGFNYNGGTLSPVGTFTHTSGAVSFGKDYSTTATGSYTFTAGTLTLNGFNLTTGVFSSSNANTRSIAFGSNNIILATTTVAQTVLDMATATNFTWTGTGGFAAAASVTRTFTFGTTGGTSTNAPNLTLSGTTATQTFTTGSWFNKLDFGSTSFTVPTTNLNLKSLTLSSGGTYTNLTATMRDTGTITPNGKSIGPFNVNHSGTTTLAGNFGCTSYTQTAGNVDFATYNLTCSSNADYTAGTLSNIGTISCTNLFCTGTFTMTNGTITPSAAVTVTGGFNYNGGTLGAVANFNHTSGNVTFSQAYALTATGTYTLTAGTLTLNGYDLTTGIFSSALSNTRSIAFGSNNIILAHTTAAQTVLLMTDALNFTWTGTGGFVSDASVTRTFTFGFVSGSSTNAPNLSFTGSGTAVQTITDNGSWFNNLDFGSTSFTLPGAIIRVNNISLASGVNYTGIDLYMVGTGTLTSNGKSIKSLRIETTGTVTLGDSPSFATPGTSVTTLVTGALVLNGFDLTTGIFDAGTGGTRSIAFGSNNIILAHTTPSTVVLSLTNITGFSWTGTGGFVSDASIIRSYQIGWNASAVVLNAPNLRFTGSGSATQYLRNNSWINILDFGTTSCLIRNDATTAPTTVRVNTLTLSSAGTYTSFRPVFTRTQTWTAQHSKQLLGLGVEADGATLTLDGTQTFATQVSGEPQILLNRGTLDLGGYDLTIGRFQSNASDGARVLAFGTNNIILANTIAGELNLLISYLQNFTYTGTGGFVSDASVTRTFTLGNADAANQAHRAPNLTFTGSGSAVQTFTTGSCFDTLNFGTTTFTLASVTLNVGSITLSSGGTYTALTLQTSKTGVITTNGKSLTALTINHRIAGQTTTLAQALTWNTTTAVVTLTQGNLNLSGFDLTIATFSSSNGNTRSIAFGSNNIVLAGTTAGSGLSMASVIGFSWTGTGGFAADSTVARTFVFGQTQGESGALSSVAPNLTFTSGSVTPSITGGSWFNTVDFGTTTWDYSTIGSSVLYVNSWILSPSGVFGALTPHFRGAAGILKTNGNTSLKSWYVDAVGASLTLQDTTYCAISSVVFLLSGTLDLNGYDLTCDRFDSSAATTRTLIFGSNNIKLGADQYGGSALVNITPITMATLTGFTATGTGGFILDATVAHSVAAGGTAVGSATAAMANLTYIGTGSAAISFSGGWFKTVNFGTITSTVSGGLAVSNVIFSAGGTYTSLALSVRDTGTITSNGKTISNFTINHSGTTTLIGDLATGLTNTVTLTQGTLDLGGYNLTTGIFSSSNSNTRSIIFGSNNITIDCTTTPLTVLGMATATNFTLSATTGGFVIENNRAKTLSFGSTAGGSSSNAPNLKYIGTNTVSITLTTGSYFNLIDWGTVGGGLHSHTINVNSAILSSNVNATYSGLGLTTVGTGTITTNGQLIQQLNINCPEGTTTLNGNVITTTTQTSTLIAGTLDLANYSFRTGIFSSNNQNNRSIAFGTTGSLILFFSNATNSTCLAMADATGFTYTGTPTVTAAMNVTRTFNFGTTAGGSASNALNLSLTSGASIPTFTSGSWFKALDFTGTTSTPAITSVYVDTLTLATGGTYTNLIPIFTRTQTWTPQFSKQLAGIGCNIPGGTLTLEATQTYTATSTLNLVAGTLDLGGANKTFGSFISNSTETRVIAFSSNNIILAHTTAGTTVINVPDATGLSYTGTGGFSTAMSVNRTFNFGGTAGGSATNAPSLSLTSGAGTPTFTDSSWFKTLNFTGSTSSLTTATKLYVDTLTLATGGTYTGLSPIFTRTQTWTPQYSKQLGGIGVSGGTLTLGDTQTYGPDSTLYVNGGTLNLNSTNQSFYNFVSTTTGSRTITGGGSITYLNSWTVTYGSGFTGSGYTIYALGSSFDGGGGSYGTLSSQWPVGNLTISGSNSFDDIQQNNSNSITTIESMIMSGGGGGGGRITYGAFTSSGGGGAGGVLTSYATLAPGTYTVTVGTGGAGGTIGGSGGDGNSSSITGAKISPISTYGGGGGGSPNQSIGGEGRPGGSGGGVGPANSYNSGTPAGKGVYPGSSYVSATRQGYDGGGEGPNSYGGGGGGGAGGAGQPNPGSSGAATINGGQGGVGILSTITGTSTYYGGGGGGGAVTGYGGNGGQGGGGRGGDANSVNGYAGTTNTGGGGGGSLSNGLGGAGGSGIVVIRYPDTSAAATSTTGSPTYTVAGGYRVYTFTSSGTITL